MAWKFSTSTGAQKTAPATAITGYGTSLPGSPTDGMEYVLVDSTTNPTYQWRFRYNAGSASAYKWEFIGGSLLSKGVDPSVILNTLTQVGATGYYYHATMSFTVPRAGDWTVRTRVTFDNNADGNNPLIGTFAGAALSFAESRAVPVTTAGQLQEASIGGTAFGVAASTVIGGAAGGGVATKKLRFSEVWIQPVRVS